MTSDLDLTHIPIVLCTVFPKCLGYVWENHNGESPIIIIIRKRKCEVSRIATRGTEIKSCLVIEEFAMETMDCGQVFFTDVDFTHNVTFANCESSRVCMHQEVSQSPCWGWTT